MSTDFDKKLNKYKKSIHTGSEGVKRLPRVPSGVFAFDVRTGGGVPLWRYTMFHGTKSSGKTTHMLRVIGNFLQIYEDMHALLIDFEQSFDPAYAENFIEQSDLDRLIVVNPDYAEEGVDICIDLMKDPSVGMVLVDSLASMVSTEDAEKSATEDSMAQNVKVINKLLRKSVPIMSAARKAERPLIFLVLNQMRSNVGARAFQSQTKKPGGFYAEHLMHLDVKFYFVKHKKVGDVPVLATHQFSVEKSKIDNCIPKTSGEYITALVDMGTTSTGHTDDFETVFKSAKKYGFFVKEGTKWLFNGEQFKNLAEIMDYLQEEEHQDAYYKLMSLVMEAMIENPVLLGSDSDDD